MGHKSVHLLQLQGGLKSYAIHLLVFFSFSSLVAWKTAAWTFRVNDRVNDDRSAIFECSLCIWALRPAFCIVKAHEHGLQCKILERSRWCHADLTSPLWIWPFVCMCVFVNACCTSLMKPSYSPALQRGLIRVRENDGEKMKRFIAKRRWPSISIRSPHIAWYADIFTRRSTHITLLCTVNVTNLHSFAESEEICQVK